jgi:drug/metabolite transporter (DMT)-like permease
MKSPLAKLPPAVAVGLILAIILDTFIQLAWKMAVGGVPAGASPGATLHAVLSTRLFYAAMLAFAAQLWNWLRVLARADLSFAQPFTALSYVTVLAISARSLQEHISASRAIGVALILLGVYFISRTPFLTPGAAGPFAAVPDSPRR